MNETSDKAIRVSPGEAARRRSAAWRGMTAEIVQFTANGPFEYAFRAPLHLFIAIDVAHFCDIEWFRTQAAAAAEQIRSGERAPGVPQLFTPGEPEWRRRQSAAGRITLEPSVIAMLERFAGHLGVATDLSDEPVKETRHV